MGLASFLNRVHPIQDLPPTESFAGLLLCASASDGNVSDHGLNRLANCLSRMKLYRRVRGGEYNTLIMKLQRLLVRRGNGALLDACVECLPAELSLPAFANACDIVMCDTVLTAEERSFLDKLVESLSIEPGIAVEMEEIISSKNQATSQGL